MKMGGVVVMRLVLISSLVLNCCSPMQLIHPRLQGNETDRQALLAIKAQIQHDPNQVTSSWNETLHFCMWHGITCGQRHRQRVTKLELGSLELLGSISPHIGNLSFLRVLDLKNNSFTHQIPPQIGQLRRLKLLYLNNNSITGTLPPNISNCFQLFFLDLSQNNLEGKVPPNLMSPLSKLRFLVLHVNNLTGHIPPSFGNLSSLEELSMYSNNFEGSIPSSLCQFRKLRYFYLGLNKLSGIIPSCIYKNHSGLVGFDVQGNQIQGSLPSNLGNAFPNVEMLSITENQFTGTIPLSISNATNLVVFQCTYNKLTGQLPNLRNLHNLRRLSVSENYFGSGKDGDLSFVSDLINATQLTWLAFSYNQFGGTIPTSISNLSTNLKWLSMGGNYLHGSIPSGLGNLKNLLVLGMEANNLSGSIPKDLGKVSRLGLLALNDNKFSGSIPSFLGNLTMLNTLSLAGNNFRGSIPSSLGKCHGLQRLELSQNNLDGKLPPQLLIGLLSLTISLNLSTNHFTGSLPVEIGNLKALGMLDISNNMLSGELPNSLGSCQSLEVLDLHGNLFNGFIPLSMQELKGLRDLDISRNKLSGDIPRFLESLKLEYLNLSFNQLQGAVPTGGVFNNASATSIAGNARLCGGMASFRLPLCKLDESKEEGLSRRKKLMILLVSGFTLLGLSVVLWYSLLHRKRKETQSSTVENSGLQISYATLFKATDNFSPANLIGVGAFGSVYKGILASDGVVAVKVLNMLHRRASKSFTAECEALRNIRHRNLVKILTVCSSIDFSGNDFMALVYEFMDNGSLEEWLHPSTGAPKLLSLVQRLNIAIDVASALDYLHNHCETPIVHCDLKPSNVLLDSDLVGHISDFGLSKFLSEPTTNIVSQNQSSSIGIRGSVGYAAPEYGMGSEVSTQGDVYSFGIILLEMFTGKRPTDHMFSDDLNLHTYVKTTPFRSVLEISELLFLQEAGTTDVVEAHKSSQLSAKTRKIEECLTLILSVGVACSVESPSNRKDISHVASELQSIRCNLLE